MNTSSNEKKKEERIKLQQDENENPETRINELENENFILKERIEFLEMQIKVFKYSSNL